MKMKLSDLAEKLRYRLGDGTADIPDDFIISGYNWSINTLPTVPRLEKLFASHRQYNLDAKGHYKFNVNGDFRRVTDIPLLEFYSSTGGDPCPLNLCELPTVEFYKKNGLVSMKQAGTPCTYTIETEDDEVWIVLDRPSDVPIIVDIIAYGFPKPVESMDDEIDISAIAEGLILDVMVAYYLHEADDFAEAQTIENYLDNKRVIEAIQLLNKKWGVEKARVLGEVQ